MFTLADLTILYKMGGAISIETFRIKPEVVWNNKHVLICCSPPSRIMSQFLRLLLFAPTIVSPLVSLMMVVPAHANDVNWINVTPSYTCMRAPTREAKQLVCKRVDAGTTATGQLFDLRQLKAISPPSEAEISPETFPMTLDFTDEESNASVALFGCDCPACIRSLRTLRSMMS